MRLAWSRVHSAAAHRQVCCRRSAARCFSTYRVYELLPDVLHFSLQVFECVLHCRNGCLPAVGLHLRTRGE